MKPLALLLLAALSLLLAPPEPAAAGWCFGVKPICLNGRVVCVCDNFGQNCYWACAASGAR